MSNETKPEVVDKANQLKEMFAALITERIGGDKNHGWGVDDSLAVIEGMHDYAKHIGASTEDIRPYVKWAINPSAARQTLEAKGALNPSQKKVSGILSGMNL